MLQKWISSKFGLYQQFCFRQGLYKFLQKQGKHLLSHLIQSLSTWQFQMINTANTDAIDLDFRELIDPVLLGIHQQVRIV